jgi:hypothetical protein
LFNIFNSQVLKLKKELDAQKSEKEYFMSTINLQSEMMKQRKMEESKQLELKQIETTPMSSQRQASDAKYISIFDKYNNSKSFSPAYNSKASQNKQIQTLEDSSILLNPNLGSTIKPPSQCTSSTQTSLTHFSTIEVAQLQK